jgi:hypothetical protein
MASAPRRWIAAAALLAAVAGGVMLLSRRPDQSRTVSTVAAPAATTIAGSRVGFSPGADILWASPQDQARELDLMAATGAHWLRLDFPWPSIEPTKGKWNWAPFDSIVAAARVRGFEIVGLPGYAPSWAAQAVSPGVPPVAPAAYASFVGALATRYGPQGLHVWELWNEPNLQPSWGAKPDAKAYAALLKAGGASIRAADPTARILSGGLAPATDAGDGTEISPVTFVKGIYAAGAGTSLDAVAIHPYSYPAMPRDPSTGSWNTYERLPLVHDVMAANGDDAKQVWLTEFGAPTGSASGAVSLDAQVKVARAGLLGAQDWAWSGPIFWYAARDRGTDPADREANFGLVRMDFSPKPAYSAFTETIDRSASAPAPFNDLFVPPTDLPTNATQIIRGLTIER